MSVHDVEIDGLQSQTTLTKRCESVSISADTWCCLISTLFVNVADAEKQYHVTRWIAVYPYHHHTENNTYQTQARLYIVNKHTYQHGLAQARLLILVALTRVVAVVHDYVRAHALLYEHVHRHVARVC